MNRSVVATVPFHVHTYKYRFFLVCFFFFFFVCFCGGECSHAVSQHVKRTRVPIEFFFFVVAAPAARDLTQKRGTEDAIFENESIITLPRGISFAVRHVARERTHANVIYFLIYCLLIQINYFLLVLLFLVQQKTERGKGWEGVRWKDRDARHNNGKYCRGAHDNVCGGGKT